MPVIVSPAQALLPDIQRLIIRYLVEGRRRKLSVSGDWKCSIRELLWVCSSWRQEALECMWRELSLTISNEIFIKHPKFAKHFSFPDNASELAKELHIQVTISSIVSGEACLLLSEFMGNTTNLPLVRKLLVKVKDCPLELDLTNDCAISNILKFARLLQSIIRVSKVSTEIKFYDTCFKTNELTEEHFGMLVMLMCSEEDHSKYFIDQISLHRTTTTFHMPMLTSLYLSYGMQSDRCISLMHKSASTLLNLDMEVTDASGLVYDADGFPVIYPNLQRLRMYDQSDFNCKRISVPDIIAFPKLKKLDLDLEYPFGDDLPFRGNNVGLEYLGVYTDCINVKVLNDSLGFAKQCKSLKKVVVHDYPQGVDLDYVGQVDMTRFLRKLTSSAQILKLTTHTVVDNLIAFPSHKYGLENVRSLDISWAYVSLFKVLYLIKALPDLQKLTWECHGLGAELEGIAKDELPDHIVSTMGNLGSCLYKLHLIKFRLPPMEKVVECIMLLALVCPKLYTVSSWDWRISEYRDELAKVLESNGPFSKYASRLGKLLE